MILEEEVSHVQFGVKWFTFLCDQFNLDSKQEYSRFLETQKVKINRPNKEERDKAGFTFYP